MNDQFDVLIVGGGVIGSAVARELSRYELRIGVLEKNRDVCNETSGRNSAVIHGGFAYDPGTLKAKLCVEGCLEFNDVAKELDVPFIRTGKVLVGNTNEDMASLERTLETGKKNGSRGLEIIGKERLQELVPAVNGEFALFSPYSGIVETFHYTFALAENAVMNGAKYFLDHEVNAIRREKDDRYRLDTNHGSFITRWIINCAGLSCAKISEMMGIPGYRIVYSKGDYIILDKNIGPLLPMPVYPVPSNTYMGIHVTPTVHGNVTVGPNAEYVQNTEYYGVSAKNIDYLAESASTLWPHIHKSDYIRNYSGILPKWVDEKGTIQDFRIEARDDIAPNTVNLVGIESPGLTAALPIARYAVNIISERETLKKRNGFNPVRKGIIHFADQTDEMKDKLISEDSDYGEVICRCEKVTKAEIVQAVHNPLGVETMTGIKYRTRSMMGRCQGGYCQMRIAQIIEEELGKKETDILYARNGSYLFTGRVRTK
jgi:glycerol-3-phosphate dehydrogenase